MAKNPPPCKDCRWFVDFHLTAFGVRIYRACINRQNILSESPYALRGREDLCGPSVKWFEPRDGVATEEGGGTNDQYQC